MTAKADLTVPVGERYFEDYVPGSVLEFGTIPVGASDIIAFGMQFDPQPFHTDPEAAARGPFGGLIASGWHTVSLTMRLFSDRYLSKVASLGSPGVDEVRWLEPVRPGDVLSVRLTILDARRSRSKPDRGVVRTRVEALNQYGRVVMSFIAVNLLRCRSAGPPV